MHVLRISFIALVVSTLELATPPRSEGAEATPAPSNPQAPSRHPRYESEYQHRVFKGTGNGELSYGWLTPLKPEAGEKYPLVICLHGAGGGVKASSVLIRPPMRQQHPAFVMVPEADRPFTWAKTDVIKRAGLPPELPEKLPVLIETIRSLLKTESIDPARIYITGQSMGGVGSWGAIARYPELFAAAVPVCGAWHVEDVPKMKGVAVWAFHGEKDPTVPVAFSRDLTAALTKAGGTARYTEYPEVPHNSWEKAYEETEMWKWLFGQRKAAAGN
ncbi:MAG: prolyl oligopeptidase family serine peptidase [Chthoniobacter sp.]|uniref:carboxylesterase family protein n=1 Tax=Chthoniobacter sp. TaxID=2510640 RepID=UPI0032A996DF